MSADRGTNRSSADTASPRVAAPQSFAVRAALYALRFYKAYLSLLIAGSCRYQPTCSQYAYEAIEGFGVLRGSWLGCKRLLRCHPFSRHFGFDPVPEEWRGQPISRASHHPDLRNHKEAHS
jgi:putative membrane protein insertion efficiency factor